MNRTFVGLASALLLGLIPPAGHATPVASKAINAANPSVVLVQGWWEEEHRWDSARQRYWHLPPPALDRYNQLQYEINQLLEQRHEIDERLRDAQGEQHRILGFEGR